MWKEISIFKGDRTMSDCPRCNSGAKTHIGRADMGIITIDVWVCDTSLLVYKTTYWAKIKEIEQ